MCVEQGGPGQLEAEDREQPWVGRLLDLYVRLLDKGEGMAPSPSFTPARLQHASHAVPLAAYSLALQGMAGASARCGVVQVVCAVICACKPACV